MDRSDRLSLSSQAPLCNEDRQITWRDVKVDGISHSFFILTSWSPVQGILPTALILLLTLVITLTVIPYAFSNVLRQMEAVRALEEAELSRLEGAEKLDTNHFTSIKNSVEDL